MDRSDNNKRINRVQEAYLHELSLILRQEAREPRLAGVWVTRVVFTPDLRLAKVYFNADGGRVREEEIIRGFVRSKSFLRRELAGRVRLKFAPELKFYYDESGEIKEHIDDLFRQIASARVVREDK